MKRHQIIFVAHVFLANVSVSDCFPRQSPVIPGRMLTGWGGSRLGVGACQDIPKFYSIAHHPDADAYPMFFRTGKQCTSEQMHHCLLMTQGGKTCFFSHAFLRQPRQRFYSLRFPTARRKGRPTEFGVQSA